MPASLVAVAGHLPEGRVSNAQLAAAFPEWSVDKLAEKTGIHSRSIAAPGETALDLALAAARRLFATGACAPAAIDFILLCTQSPDYFQPTGACLAQDRLGIPTSAGALDINLGCSGYVYTLGLAKGLIASGQATRVLLLTADTYSRFIDPADRSVRTIFGDGATASLVADSDHGGALGAFIHGTDGRGCHHLTVEGGSLRHPDQAAVLRMDGPAIFDFTLRTVPRLASDLLARAGLDAGVVDLWVLHQANRYILEHLRRRLGVPPERLPLRLAECGNTTSSSIPLVLEQLASEGRLAAGHRLALLGFGGGLSWSGALVDWR